MQSLPRRGKSIVQGCGYAITNDSDHSARLIVIRERISGEERIVSDVIKQLNGGGRGIRTPGTLSGTTVFKTAGINRSPIPPQE